MHAHYTIGTETEKYGREGERKKKAQPVILGKH